MALLKPAPFILLILLLLTSCGPPSADISIDEKVAQDFFELSSKARMEQLKRHSLEEQYQLYLYGQQKIHPPTIYLSTPFAENGPVIVPLLKRELKTVKEDATIIDIAEVLAELQQLKKYRVAQDKELMQVFQARVDHIEDAYWKRYALQIVQEIKTGQPRFSPNKR